MKEWFIAAFGVAGGAIAAALGGWDTAVQALLVCMAFDYISGWIVAVVFHKSPKTETGSYASDVGAKGLARKFMVFGVVVIANMIDRLLGIDCIRDAAAIGFMANEAMSFVENLGLMGVPMPAVVTKALDVLSKKSNNTTVSQ